MCREATFGWGDRGGWQEGVVASVALMVAGAWLLRLARSRPDPGGATSACPKPSLTPRWRSRPSSPTLNAWRWAGSWPATAGMTRDAYELDSAPVRRLVHRARPPAVRRPPGRHRSVRPGPGDRSAGLGRRCRGGCARWPASTATPKRKSCSPIPRRCTSADPGSTTNPTPSAWTETRSERCSSPPAWAARPSTPWCRCWRSTGCGCRKRLRRRHRSRSASNAGIAP